MKITTFIMFFSFLQASASSFGQSLTLKAMNISYSKLFFEIHRQTGYSVLVKSSEFKSSKKFDANYQQTPLNEVIKQVVSESNLAYLIEDKTIVLKSKKTPIVADFIEGLANIDVSGRVLDENGKPLEAATIVVVGGKFHTMTNVDGLFFLKNVPENSLLKISSIGYISKEIMVAKDLGIIRMEVSTSNLQAITVASTGYQSISKERATGAYDVIGQDILSRRPVANLSTALQGLVAGMQGSENADGSVNFLIRGNSSMYADRAPLVVVDGFPISNSNFSTINPNDVASVTVLKDAAAASIWGARSGNGVIVITTKRAKQNSGITIEANVFTRMSKQTNLQQLLANASSADFVHFEKLAFQNKWTFAGSEYQGGVFPADAGAVLTLGQELLYENKYGRLSTEVMNAGLDSLAQIDNTQQLQDLLLRRSLLTQYNLSLSQASDKMRNFASVMYETNSSRFQGSGHERITMNFNNEYRPAKFITFNLGLYLQYHKQDSTGATIAELRALSPYETLLNPDGSYSANVNTFNRRMLNSISGNGFPYSDWSYNLLREVRGRNLNSHSYNVRVQTGLNIKLLKGLSLDSKFQYEKAKVETDNYFSDETFYVRNMVNTYVEYNNTTKAVGRKFLPNGGIGQPRQSDLNMYLWRSQLNYQKDFGLKHTVSAIGGVEFSQNRLENITRPWLYGYYPDLLRSTSPLYGYGSAVERFPSFTSGTVANSTLSGGNSTITYGLDRFVSYFGNAAYTYNGKYTLSGSVRADASNFIADDPAIRWSPMWSVGGMWNAKREDFLAGVDWLDVLRVRATYGKNGNVEKSTSTKTLLNVGTALNTSTGTITATISSYGNPTLTWERTTSTNIAFDFAAFRNKFFGKVDFYTRKGEDITGNIALPGASGTTSQRFNNAGIINRGIEVELGTALGNGRIGFGYNTSITYAYNKNRVTDLRSPIIYPYVLVNPGSAFVEGKPINPVYSYNYLGMENGVPMLEGNNGVPASMNTALYVTGNSFDILKYQGTATPPHTMGWFNTFDYKNLSLNMLFIGKFGGVYRNPTFNYSTATIGSTKTNVNQFVADVFAGRTDIPSFPAPNESRQYLWAQYTDYLGSLVESSSYLECKEISLNYTLPQSWISKMKMRNLRIYTQVRDLGLVWAANKNMYNPDWLPGTDRPLTSFTFGINLGI